MPSIPNRGAFGRMHDAHIRALKRCGFDGERCMKQILSTPGGFRNPGAKGAPPNRGPGELRNSVHSAVAGHGAGIVVGAMAKYARVQNDGYTLVPKNVKWLTIPAIPEAYRKRASDFQNLRFVPLPKGGNLAALMRSSKWVSVPGTKMQRLKGTPPEVVFWLVKKSTIGPHPYVIPSLQKAIKEFPKHFANIMKVG